MACLLGIEDEPIDKDGSNTSTDFKINKVGGKPNWASAEHVNPCCKLCSRQMLLAVQIYAPLDESPNHRTLYQFCCLQPECQSMPEGWTCLRDEVLDTSATTTVPTDTKAFTKPSTTWLADADDWGDDDNMEGDNGNSSYVSTEPEAVANLDISSLTIESSNSSTHKESVSSETIEATAVNTPSVEIDVDDSVILDDLPQKPTVDIRALFAPPTTTISELNEAEFASFYLSVVEEQENCSVQKLDQRAQELLREYQQRENCDFSKLPKTKGASGAQDEMYEKVTPGHGDRLVHKFIKQVQFCPEQLIRYNRGGNPLLLRQVPKSISNCRYCNAPLVFEMQLMPHLSQRLIVANCQQQTVELGTVLIYTCSKSCWNENLREEYVVVQPEIY